MSTLLIVLFVVLGVLFLVSIVASFIKWNARRVTAWFSLKKLEINKPILEYARLILDENGLEDVEVKKVGFFASMFVGNTYSPSKKLIRVSWGTALRPTPTSLAAVCQLVGLAKMHAEGKKGLRMVEFNRWFGWVPMLLLPLVLVGLIVDLVVSGSIGTYIIIFSAIGLGLALIYFILSAVAANKYIASCKIGQQLILDMGILQEKEEKKIKSLFSAWKQLAVLNVFIALFEVIYFVLRILLSGTKLFRR